MSRKCFSITLRCLDFVYGEISNIATELIANPVAKFLLKKSYEVSNLAVLGRNVGNVLHKCLCLFKKLRNWEFLMEKCAGWDMRNE